jgi:acetoin utilization deacetylase AcuC-like enzyme
VTDRESPAPASSRRQFLRGASATILAIGSRDVPPLQAQTAGTQVFFDPAMLAHQPPAGHPETATRASAAMDAIRSFEQGGTVSIGSPRRGTEDDLLLVHRPAYVKLVRNEIAAGRRRLSTGDTDVSSGSLTAALTAAGAVVTAVDAVMRGKMRNAFCVVRPPGHHASAVRGMGFCIFNNTAIGARYAQRTHGVERVLIADWDVHHGNGTQDVFWSDGSVLFFDTHQHPWYPGTGLQHENGDGKGRGLIINRPFAAGAGRGEILTAFREVLVEAAERFKPQLVMISAGFDSRRGDPLGGFTLTDTDFADLTDIVLGIARQHAAGRLVSVLEGGYSPDGLARAVSAHVGRLSG